MERSVSGTLESSDIMITIEPNTEDKISIDLDSSVEKQFGDSIRETMKATLAKFNINNARIFAKDKGALECIIIARLKAAIYNSVSVENRNNEGFKVWLN